MLKSLVIQNYVLINELRIEFNEGLSIITGETGAGKSILLGALGLVLGQRADTSVLKDNQQKCMVEGIFDIEKYHLSGLFEVHDIDEDNPLILRREITSSGKSRAFVNDTPVNLNVLREFSTQLIDIHSQHQNLLIGDNIFQLSIIDVYANTHDLLHKYKQQFTEFKSIRKKILTLEEEAVKVKTDLDYYQFQFDQIEKANLQEDEQEELEKEQEMLAHAEEIKAGLFMVNASISGEENALLPLLKNLENSLRKIAPFYQAASELAERMGSTYLEIKDMDGEIEKHLQYIEFDPERQEFVNQRLDLMYTLQQKHGVKTVKELLEIKEQLSEKIYSAVNLDDALLALQKKEEEIRGKLSGLAEELTTKRKAVSKELEETISGLLIQLGIPQAKFNVQYKPLDDFSLHGKDFFTFLFSANKQVEMKEISNVASGGEMSRLMLSLKSVIARSGDLPTIIFDEIDTGVSGDIADKVGEILRTMGDHMQVINITHLPQIAGKGKYHYKVYKEDLQDASHTRIKLLSEQERIMELAQMLSGEDISEAAIENAKYLLSN